MARVALTSSMVLLRMTSLKVMSFPRNLNSSHGLTGHGLKATICKYIKVLKIFRNTKGCYAISKTVHRLLFNI
jgi:hypothetical protein